jgi:hypothetical protein
MAYIWSYRSESSGDVHNMKAQTRKQLLQFLIMLNFYQYSILRILTNTKEKIGLNLFYKMIVRLAFCISTTALRRSIMPPRLVYPVLALPYSVAEPYPPDGSAG